MVLVQERNEITRALQSPQYPCLMCSGQLSFAGTILCYGHIIQLGFGNILLIHRQNNTFHDLVHCMMLLDHKSHAASHLTVTDTEEYTPLPSAA